MGKVMSGKVARVLLALLCVLGMSVLGGCSGGTRGTNVGSSGTVKTETGEPVPNASVTDLLSGNSTTTNQEGGYVLSGIPANAETALEVVVDGRTASFSVTTSDKDIEANFVFNSKTGDITAVIKEKSSESSENKEEGGSLNPKPNPTPKPNDESKDIEDEKSGGGSGNKAPPTPTPSPSATPNQGAPQPVRNRKLEACLESKFFVGTTALPDLSCERECAKEATANAAGFQAFYLEECVANTNFLSNNIVPRCQEFACIEFCGALITQDPTHWVSEAIAEARANLSCEGAE